MDARMPRMDGLTATVALRKANARLHHRASAPTR